MGRIDGSPAPPVAKETVVVHDDALNIDRKVIAGQPVPADLVDAYRDAVGEDREEPQPEAPVNDGQIVATEDIVVHDDNLGIDRKLVAGQPVPPDLADAYRAKVGDEQAETTPGEDTGGSPDPDPITEDYGSYSPELLQGEVERRGLTVEGTGASGNVVKGDLVSALEANDEIENGGDA